MTDEAGEKQGLSVQLRRLDFHLEPPRVLLLTKCTVIIKSVTSQ